MRTSDPANFHGIYPSVICPLKADGSVDEATFASHVRAVTDVDGVVGVLCNGHAGENFVLDRAEKRRVVEIVREVLDERAIIVAGINCESSLKAADEARDVQDAGAHAVMVFPPNSWALSQDDGMALAHHRLIDEAVNIPLMLFQGSVKAGQIAYSQKVLAQLLHIPSVVAIKEGSWETSAYEATRRLTQELAPEVGVMASGDEHLFTSYVLGSEGSIVSLAAVIPQTIVALDRAVRDGDLAAARRAHEVIYPLAKAIYGTPPGGHATARLKTCLRLLGRLENDAVRLPMQRLDSSEEAMLCQALSQAGLLDLGGQLQTTRRQP